MTPEDAWKLHVVPIVNELDGDEYIRGVLRSQYKLVSEQNKDPSKPVKPGMKTLRYNEKTDCAVCPKDEGY